MIDGFLGVGCGLILDRWEERVDRAIVVLEVGLGPLERGGDEVLHASDPGSEMCRASGDTLMKGDAGLDMGPVSLEEPSGPLVEGSGGGDEAEAVVAWIGGGTLVVYMLAAKDPHVLCVFPKDGKKSTGPLLAASVVRCRRVMELVLKGYPL